MLGKFKTAFVLVIVGALSGFLIWGTNELTNDDILLNRELREQAYYKDIFGLDESVEITYDAEVIDELLEEIIIYDVDSNVLGYIYKGTDKNNYGDIVILVGISLDEEISNVVISSSTNTVLYVKNIKDNYLVPFVGQDADGVEYDSSTGASFTYGSVKKVVKAASSYYLENRGDE